MPVSWRSFKINAVRMQVSLYMTLLFWLYNEQAYECPATHKVALRQIYYTNGFNISERRWEFYASRWLSDRYVWKKGASKRNTSQGWNWYWYYMQPVFLFNFAIYIPFHQTLFGYYTVVHSAYITLAPFSYRACFNQTWFARTRILQAAADREKWTPFYNL